MVFPGTGQGRTPGFCSGGFGEVPAGAGLGVLGRGSPEGPPERGRAAPIPLPALGGRREFPGNNRRGNRSLFSGRGAIPGGAEPCQSRSCRGRAGPRALPGVLGVKRSFFPNKASIHPKLLPWRSRAGADPSPEPRTQKPWGEKIPVFLPVPQGGIPGGGDGSRGDPRPIPAHSRRDRQSRPHPRGQIRDQKGLRPGHIPDSHPEFPALGRAGNTNPGGSRGSRPALGALGGIQIIRENFGNSRPVRRRRTRACQAPSGMDKPPDSDPKSQNSPFTVRAAVFSGRRPARGRRAGIPWGPGARTPAEAWECSKAGAAGAGRAQPARPGAASVPGIEFPGKKTHLGRGFWDWRGIWDRAGECAGSGGA